MFNIVLVTPQIPNNTGAIGRLCVNTGSSLHLIKPIGFDIDEKAVRRAGLDYWHKIDLHVWENIDDFMNAHPNTERFFFATTKTDRPYFELDFKEGDYLLFGSETSGIPSDILESFPNQTMTIPMTKEGRSLNLAISSGIILYEAIKQNFNSYRKMM
ncbi:tRNA (cytidine(34)-2'-O)-methyltransferase [Sulfuricurvum sp. RIFCSPLOWO2_12_FULL_43_24]|uniref:tRNA (cytidine(34)-2'-O)-methyltransferase n=1 Tax=Sulfuricurvum sp. RIFCSPLOWO2_12_FULL_43_24 TaxID=1802247 RepID=UPI0008CFD5C3|nr:tRNA (cytidine(34)-2'-O)-methyltransferase [Sulfuricurvum sp. RIFCSPLOWO2_12_FULL_43_24]OHD83909.1 MAG: RNA methyltransferase [Sulfuricurvum sp. RIFCSPLOWO2_02_43_6]OHD85630.1 MAG: RNA methyltransferase [Sulfuricurvum sp. RIFCSPLOWO2_02_FULL_43_45]OHD88579.1 MAG: RNA methyltransferase [Sulfuricurvum sp. RIFCSPLOWO2_12_FULL_43_24]OHD91133.1 MAG: RNA methyltransferase [Sulfuricurvum sp. RIFCSPLOWO2_12_43_5]